MADCIGMIVTLALLAGGILGGLAITIINIISDWRERK